jgi:4-amino-4-deoxy-L-arabinose transferase-like glycosyltransferase
MFATGFTSTVMTPLFTVLILVAGVSFGLALAMAILIQRREAEPPMTPASAWTWIIIAGICLGGAILEAMRAATQ